MAVFLSHTFLTARYTFTMETTVLRVGDTAPTATLPDQSGKVRSLADVRGSWILLYFYPRDNTPGCTIEACTLRDNYGELKKAGLAIFGVSTDSVESHQKFAGKHQLPFLLLADTEKALAKAYGVWGPKKFLGREFLGTHRISFLINPQGKIAKVYEKVKPAEHAAEILRDLTALRG